MVCHDVQSRLSALLDKTVPDTERVALLEHLEGCMACAAELRQLGAVDRALQAAPAPEIPEGYFPELWSRLTMTMDGDKQSEPMGAEGDGAKEEAAPPDGGDTGADRKEDAPPPAEDASPKEQPPPAAGAKREDDKDLLDIRAIASRDITARESGRSREMEAAAAVSSVDIPAAVSQPIMPAAPREEARSRSWVAPVAAVGALVVVAGIAGAVLLSGRRVLVRAPSPEGAPAVTSVPADYAPERPAVAAAPESQPVPAAAGPAVAMAVPNEAAPGEVEEPPPAPVPAPAPAREARAAAKRHKHAKAPHPRAKAAAPKAAPAPKPSKEPAAKSGMPALDPGKPAAGKSDDLDALLSAGAKKKQEEKPVEEDTLPATLSQAQIKKGMGSVKGQVNQCFKKHNEPGLAKVSVHISGSTGSVRSVAVTGKFKGTPTGACVKAAVKGAAFPKFKARNLTISYTFLLR